jgi:hypothetical protein
VLSFTKEMAISLADMDFAYASEAAELKTATDANAKIKAVATAKGLAL